MELTVVEPHQIDIVMDIIHQAKKHLKEQGIDQWQTGYPDYECIKSDILNSKGYFVVDKNDILGYMCIDFDGEVAYNSLKGKWQSEEDYVVVHRMAFDKKARGKKLSEQVFRLVENLSLSKGVNYFRVDTDEANKKMIHVLEKSGFEYAGTIWFDNSEKIGFDKIMHTTLLKGENREENVI